MSCYIGIHRAVAQIVKNKPWFKYKEGDNFIQILPSPKEKINKLNITGVANTLANSLNKAINTDIKLGQVFYATQKKEIKQGVYIKPTNKQLDLLNAKEISDILELQKEVEKEIQEKELKFRQKEGNWQVNEEGDIVPFEEDDDYLFQKESKGTLNEALNNIIRIFLSKANFNVEEVFDEIKTQTGEDATASVDLFNRLIKISKNKQGEDTLTEEGVHVFTAMLGPDHLLYQKMIALVEQTEVWESTLSEYNTVYNGNMDKIKKEAMDKMVTKIVVQKFKKNELNTTPDTIWNKFSKLVQAAFKWLSNKFKNVPDTFESEIEKVYGEAADMLLTGNVPQGEITSTETFFQLDSDKKKKSDYKDAIQEQIERSEIKIQRIKKQTPNWKNNPKASVAISKLEEYIKNLKEDRALILIENKANNELNAISDKLDDFDNIADKEGFFTYALDTLKGWQDLDEFITYPEDEVGKNRIIAMTGRANNLEKVLMNKFQDFASEKYGEDFNSSIIDESFFGANFLDIAQSKIPILRKIGEFINKARFTAYELTKQLETKVNEEFELLKKWSGYKSDKELWDLFRQKDSKGNWTGNYVAEISNEFYEKKKELATWAKENKSFSAYYRWLNANTNKVFDKEAFDAMYGQVKTNEFTQTDGAIDEAGLQAWVKANDENSNKSPFITYTPKVELWKDKQYEYIQSVPELKRFYDFFINTLKERKSVLPDYERQQSNYLPEQKRNTFLDFSKGGMTGLLKEWTNQFKDSFANDIESSKETVLRDPITGEPEKTIPVYMMADRLNPEDKEYDLTKVLKSFGAMSYMYEQKNAIEEPVKLMSSLFRNLKEKLVAEGTDKTDRFGKLVEILDGNKQAVSMMDYHIDAMLYDKTREDDTTKKLGEITVNGETKKVTAGSIIDWLINYTRIKGLSLNIFSGVTNVLFGVSSNFIYAEGKKDFTPQQATDAFGIMLNAVVKGSNTNKKVNFLMDKFRIKPEAVSSEGANINKYLYAFTEAGEYINYGQTGIATLLNTKIKNLKGETKSLYDAYIIQDGKVVWNTKEFGQEQYSDLSEEKYNLAAHIQGLNKRIHGNYDPEYPIKIKSHVWGRAVMIFRSWLPMAIYTRFGSVNMSKELGRETKGRYITGLEYAKQNKFGVLLPVFKELMTQVINTSTLNRLQLKSGAFDELSELDKENMLRNVAELRYILFFMLLGTLLKGMTIDDDDEEKVALTKFIINQTDRVEGELSFFFSPYDQSRIIRDISPVSRTFKDFYDLVPATTRLLTGEDELKSGPNKGDSNFYRQLKQAVPIVTQIQKAAELEDLNVDNPMVR